MELYELTDNLMAGGQTGPDAVPLLAGQGIRAIVRNRFGGEEPGQPEFLPAGRITAAGAGHGVTGLPQRFQLLHRPQP